MQLGYFNGHCRGCCIADKKADITTRKTVDKGQGRLHDDDQNCGDSGMTDEARAGAVSATM